MDSMKSPDLWTRARKARLGRVALVNAGASWAIIEATDLFIGLVVVVATAIIQARPAGEVRHVIYGFLARYLDPPRPEIELGLGANGRAAP